MADRDQIIVGEVEFLKGIQTLDDIKGFVALFSPKALYSAK